MGFRSYIKEFVAKIIFSVGFRSYIREFLGAILMFFRPLLNRRSRRSRSSSRRKQKEKVAKIFVFCGFQKLH